FEIGATVPFRIVSGTVDPDFVGNADDPRDNDAFNFSAQGIGDIGVHAKIRFLDTSRFPIGLAVIGSLYLPVRTADQKQRWLSEGKLTPRATVILDKEFGRLRIAGNVGYLLRSEARTFVDSGVAGSTPPVPSTGKRVTVKGEIPFGVGAAVALVTQRVDLVAEV